MIRTPSFVTKPRTSTKKHLNTHFHTETYKKTKTIHCKIKQSKTKACKTKRYNKIKKSKVKTFIFIA